VQQQASAAVASQAIVGGEQNDSAFPAVGYLQGRDGDCTATLIAPNVILTAAHCFDYGSAEAQDGKLNGIFDFNTGTNGERDNFCYVLEYQSFPGSNSNDDSTDFAVARLERSLTPDYPDWTPALDVPDATPDDDATVSLFGYGCDDPSWQNKHWACPQGETPIKREVDLTWNMLSDFTLETDPAQHPVYATHGDSGGPVITAGTYDIVAVHSGAIDHTDRNGNFISRTETYADIVKHYDWIQDAVFAYENQ
jgi:V8-like Glu-specific endopeptidase